MNRRDCLITLLVCDYEDWTDSLNKCDPSVDEDALMDFIDLQNMTGIMNTRAHALGFADLDAFAEYAERHATR